MHVYSCPYLQGYCTVTFAKKIEPARSCSAAAESVKAKIIMIIMYQLILILFSMLIMMLNDDKCAAVSTRMSILSAVKFSAAPLKF